MFADEDFDPDEDFFNDLTQKETQYYSQEFNSIEESRVKRFKKDDNSPGLHRSNISNSVGNHVTPNPNDSGGDQSDRRRLILERLKRCKNTNSVSSTDQRANQTVSNSLSSNTGTSDFAPAPVSRNFQSLQKNNGESLAASTHSLDNKFCPNLIKNVDSSTAKLELCNKSRNSPFKGPNPFKKPVTLVREFPGPAGLLPNSSSRISPPVSLNSSGNNHGNDEMDIDVEEKSFAISKYCSQNTTNSFMDSPWQSLLNDMGDDFLHGHEISMIKCKAVGSLYKNDKVPYLVGKVQRVDLNYLEPVIELKDYTGTIQGTVCKDIVVDFPQLLDVGNVWFLQNVGLLTTGDTMRNAHVIIALKNVVNVYTPDSKFFNNSEMEARLENFNADSDPSEPALNNESESSCFFNTKLGHRPNTDCSKERQNMKPPLRPGNFENICTATSTRERVASGTFSRSDASALPRTPAMHGRKNLFSDNHENPVDPQAKLDPSRGIENKSNKFTFESEEFEDFDDDDIDSLFSGVDNGMASKTLTKMDSAEIIKTGESNCASRTQNTTISGRNTVLNTVHLNTRLSDNEQSTESVSKVTSVTIKRAERIPEKVSVATKENCNLPKTSNIALKLSVFRSEAALTPPSSEELDLTTTDIHKQNEAKDESSLKSVSFLEKEDDSDEELFSQVDIESVFSRYDNLKD